MTWADPKAKKRWMADYREKNRERLRAQARTWRKKNAKHLKAYRRHFLREHREELLRYWRDYRAKNKGRKSANDRRSHLSRRYGLTLETFGKAADYLGGRR